MSRLYYSRPDSVDEDVIKWLSTEIKVSELIKRKTAYQILKEDVIPNLQSLISRLSPQKIDHLVNCDILEKQTHELLPLGKGYLFNFILELT